jgi:CubicO group peptidase (beta-lactamase class C family)
MGIDLTAIGGWVADGYEPVRDAFAKNFETDELGASFCAYVNGLPVVDIWGGTANEKTGAAWSQETTAVVFSATKGMTALCANMLIDRGQLDPDAPVVEYWPTFAGGQAVKARIPVRWLLTHQAGMAVIDEPLTTEDVVAWDPVIEKLERQAPVWEPGTAQGYHASTFGWLVGEVVRRVAGVSVGQFFASEVAGPLGVEAWIGLPETEDHRVARLRMQLPGDPGTMNAAEFTDRESLLGRVFANPGRDVIAVSKPTMLRAEFPAGSGVANARGLARMYAATISSVDGTRLLTDATVNAARAVAAEGTDVVLQFDVRRGLGFELPDSMFGFSGDGSFGHMGAGGAVGWAHPERGLAIGYVPNRMVLNFAEDRRVPRILEALDGVPS